MSENESYGVVGAYAEGIYSEVEDVAQGMEVELTEEQKITVTNAVVDDEGLTQEITDTIRTAIEKVLEGE